MPGDHLIHHDAKRVDVGADIDRMRIQHLFWGHIGRRANHAVRLRGSHI